MQERSHVSARFLNSVGKLSANRRPAPERKIDEAIARPAAARDGPAGAALLNTSLPARENPAQEFIALVERFIAELDAQHRDILILCSVLNGSYQEIAAQLGIALGTVRRRITRARERLRLRLAEACPDFAAD
jgi:RNA polymerase sigma factor (sigma-70 family)